MIRDNLPLPNCDSDCKAENKWQRIVVWLIYHQSECQEELIFVNFPCASESDSCQIWASVDPPVNCVSCGMEMYRCSICKMLTEKLQNCNGFFTTHRYPPFLKFRQRERIFFNFQQWREAFINNDTKLFNTQTSDMGPTLAGPDINKKDIIVD